MASIQSSSLTIGILFEGNSLRLFISSSNIKDFSSYSSTPLSPLSPKAKHFSNLSYYKHISLYNTVYKIAAKFLANRTFRFILFKYFLRSLKILVSTILQRVNWHLSASLSRINYSYYSSILSIIPHDKDVILWNESQKINSHLIKKSTFNSS